MKFKLNLGLVAVGDASNTRFVRPSELTCRTRLPGLLRAPLSLISRRSFCDLLLWSPGQ
jgi:hypothetical protein